IPPGGSKVFQLTLDGNATFTDGDGTLWKVVPDGAYGGGHSAYDTDANHTVFVGPNPVRQLPSTPGEKVAASSLVPPYIDICFPLDGASYPGPIDCLEAVYTVIDNDDPHPTTSCSSMLSGSVGTLSITSTDISGNTDMVTISYAISPLTICPALSDWGLILLTVLLLTTGAFMALHGDGGRTTRSSRRRATGVG